MNHPDEQGVEVTLIVPRSALPPPPVDCYSQRNCDLLGLSRRQFLELLRRSGAPAVTKVGRMRLVRRDDMLDFLDRIRREDAAKTPEPRDGADEVLLEMGCAPKAKKAG